MIDIEKASKQEVFDFVVEKLLAQKRRSLRSASRSGAPNGEICAYRSDDGARCAAGWLLPDELYTVDIEGKAWDCLVATGAVPDVHSDLILAMQSIHDKHEPHDWPEQFLDLATAHHLDPERVYAAAPRLRPARV